LSLLKNPFGLRIGLAAEDHGAAPGLHRRGDPRLDRQPVDALEVDLEAEIRSFALLNPQGLRLCGREHGRAIPLADIHAQLRPIVVEWPGLHRLSLPTFMKREAINQ
jgi:hypothetical protein